MAERRHGAGIVTRAAVSFVVIGALLAPAPAASADVWVQPSFVRSMGGIGRPGVFAWGLSFNPVSREVIVGDYLNFRVRRYSTGGAHLGDLPPRPGEVWATGVDRTNGDIYYSNNWDNSIHRFDRNGNHIRAITMASGWNAWFDVDKSGVLWVVFGSPQSTTYSLQRYSRDGVHLGTWNLPNTFPKKMTVFGIGVADDGRVYLPDSNNRQIQVYRPDGTLERTFGQGVLGTDLRGIAIDEARQWLYTSDSATNRVRKFALGGTHLGEIGGPGNGAGKFRAPRQLDVDPLTGNLYVADYGNWRYQVFSPSGTFLASYPNPAQAAAAGHLAHAADAVVDPSTGDVWVADTYNQRFQRFAPDGRQTGSWGFRGGTEPFGQNYPSTIGFDPVNRRVWVGQEEGRVIKIYTATGGYVTTIERGPKTPENSGYTRNVTDIDFYAGKAFISDEQYDKIKVVDAVTFQELSEIDVWNGSGWSGAHGLGIDPTNGNLFVASYSEDKVKVYSQAGALLYTFGSSGSGDGQFRSPRDVAVLGDTVYVTDAEQSRIQAFTRSGQFLGKFGGLGTGAYQFRNPMGIDTHGGELYVSDVENGRVTIFDPAHAKPPFVFHRPTATVAAPADGAVLTTGPLIVTGSAASSQHIANVEIRIQREADGRWWTGRTASWEAAATDNLAGWTAATAPSDNATFSFVFPSFERGHTYRVEVVARNRQGTPSLPVVRTVSLSS